MARSGSDLDSINTGGSLFEIDYGRTVVKWNLKLISRAHTHQVLFLPCLEDHVAEKLATWRIQGTKLNTTKQGARTHGSDS